MKLQQAFAAKEQMTKQALFDEFSDDEETMQKINAAFELGRANWSRHLQAIFGAAQTKHFFSLLGQDTDNLSTRERNRYLER